MEYSIILEKVEGRPAADLLALGPDSCRYMLMNLDLGASNNQNDGKSSWLEIGPIILAGQDDGTISQDDHPGKWSHHPGWQ